MATITITLPDELVEQLQQMAEQKNLSMDELVQMIIKDEFDRQAKIDAATDEIMHKYGDVVKRLAE